MGQQEQHGTAHPAEPVRFRAQGPRAPCAPRGRCSNGKPGRSLGRSGSLPSCTEILGFTRKRSDLSWHMLAPSFQEVLRLHGGMSRHVSAVVFPERSRFSCYSGCLFTKLHRPYHFCHGHSCSLSVIDASGLPKARMIDATQ